MPRRAAPALALLVACGAMSGRVGAASPRADASPAPAPAPQAALVAPAGLLAEGTRWQTEYFVVRGAEAGPTLLVLAGQHGDEPAGPRAAEALLGFPLRRGTLLVVPRANRLAIAAGTRSAPFTNARDLARCFPRSDEEAPQGELATALWQLVQTLRPELILDLHEGFDFHRRTGKSLGSSVLYSPVPHAERLVPRLLAAVNATIATPSKHFDPIPKPIVGSVIEAAWRRLGIPGIVLETTKAGQHLELRVRQQLVMAAALLAELGMTP